LVTTIIAYHSIVGKAGRRKNYDYNYLEGYIEG